ncbi:uncharacterized protein [Dermacentor andersoni]|uniref:uncharacterized protein isoform X1 n=1 Tax=Dermacentor andersoni TaxID=34620 RepID=UPI002415DC8C|nr:uncharacterized protein LOC126520697 isoform X1 [Dermacentor andersoni]
MLLALLKNSTRPANSTWDRAGFLWDRFVDKVREALYTTTTRRSSGSSTASRLSRSEEKPPTSVTSAASSTSPRWAESISFEEDTTIVDYGKIDDHVILDAGSTSANDSRAHSERHRLNRTGGGSWDNDASSSNYDHVEPNVKLGKAANGSNEALNGFNDTSGLGTAAGTEHVYATYGAGAGKKASRTKGTSAAWKDHEGGPIASSTPPPDASRASENKAQERVSLTSVSPSSLEAPRSEIEPIGALSANKSNDGTMRGARMQETQPEQEWGSPSIQKKDLAPQKAPTVEGKYTETGSTFLGSGVNEVVGRVTWTSRTSENNDSVDPAELEGWPLEELRRGVDAESPADSPNLRLRGSENASYATTPTSNVTLNLPGLKGTGILKDSEENFRWSKNDGDIFVAPKSDVSGATFGVPRAVPGSNQAVFEGLSSVTLGYDEGILYPLTKPSGYGRRMKVSGAGSAPHSFANETGNPAVSLVPPNSVRGTVGSVLAGDSVYPVKTDSPPPRSKTEHLLTDGSVARLYLPDVTESDESTSSPSPEALFPETYRIARTKGKTKLTVDAWSAKPLDLNNSKRTEGWVSAGEQRRRPNIADDLAYDRTLLRRQTARGGKGSAEGGRGLSERPLLNVEALTSASSAGWRPAEGTGKFRQLHVAENGDPNTEPFQEDPAPEEEAMENKATRSDTAPPSLEGHPRDFSPMPRGSSSTMTTTDSFNLLRELDRIADEFTEFLDRKERRERDEDRVYTTVDPEEELLDADEAITTIDDGDHSLAASSEVDDLGVEWDARHIGGPTSPEEAGPTAFPARDEEQFSEHPAEERRNRIARAKTESPLYCSVGPTYSGPFPPALCSYFVVYDSVHYDSSKNTLRAVFRGSWSEVADSDDRFRLGPRVLLALDANQLRAVVADFPVFVVFAAKARSLIQERSLTGLAFDLSLATDYDVRSHATLLQGTRDYMPGYHFIGLIDFVAATGLLRTNLAELAGSVHKVFLRNDPRHVHTIGTSVPNPFASSNRKSYSVENAMRLAESLRLVSPDRDHVCLSVSLAVYKFNVSDQDADAPSNPGVGSLASDVNTAFSYSELCEEYKDPHRHFDDATLSTYVHVGGAWLGFDDDMSMEIKIDKLSRGHRVGCLLADNIDLDDFRNVCKKGEFPRLRLLKRSVLSRERR